LHHWFKKLIFSFTKVLKIAQVIDQLKETHMTIIPTYAAILQRKRNKPDLNKIQYKRIALQFVPLSMNLAFSIF
jgi:hypothetical protein